MFETKAGADAAALGSDASVDFAAGSSLGFSFLGFSSLGDAGSAVFSSGFCSLGLSSLRADTGIDAVGDGGGDVADARAGDGPGDAADTIIPASADRSEG